MSLVWFAFTLKVTFAIYIGSKPVPEAALPVEVLDLEAAVLAKYSSGVTGAAGSILSSKAAHVQPAASREFQSSVSASASKLTLNRVKASNELTCQAPTDVFDFEKAQLDKYSMSKAEFRLQADGSALNEGVAPEVAEIGAEILGSSKAGIKLQMAQPRVKLQSKREPGASAAPLAVPLEVANLEAAVLAKYAADDKLLKSQDEATPLGGQPDVPLEVAKLEPAVLAKFAPAEAHQSVAQPEVPADVAKLEAAVLAKYAGDGLTSKPQAESQQAATDPQVPADVAKLEAAVLAKYAADGMQPKPEAAAIQMQAPPVEVAQLEAAVLARYVADDAADMASDMAKYSSNGETPTSQVAVPQAAALQAQVSTADVAKLEAAVLEKYATNDESLLQAVGTQDVPVHRSIARFAFYCLALISVIGCVCQKYKVIIEAMKGKHEPPQRSTKWEGSYDYSV